MATRKTRQINKDQLVSIGVEATPNTGKPLSSTQTETTKNRLYEQASSLTQITSFAFALLNAFVHSLALR